MGGAKKNKKPGTEKVLVGTRLMKHSCEYDDQAVETQKVKRADITVMLPLIPLKHFKVSAAVFR